MGATEIARRLGVGQERLNRVMAANGIPRNPVGRRPKTGA